MSGVWARLRARLRGMDDVESLHRHWTAEAPRGGEPELLVERTHRSAALVRLIADVPHDARILEVGCGPGRNLAFLFDQGWEDVEGVEINPNAVKTLRERYPQLVERPIHVGPAESVLPTLEPYDLVFTMAVLEHIHPSSSVVFDEIARLGREVLAIEPRGHSSRRQHPHDVPALFESRGFRLVSATPMSEMPETADDPYLGPDYVAWRFAR